MSRDRYRHGNGALHPLRVSITRLGGSPLPKLADNQIGDRLHAALEAIGTDEGETIRGNTALVTARQTLSLLEQGLLIAAERNSDDVSVMMNQPIVPPSE